MTSALPLSPAHEQWFQEGLDLLIAGRPTEAEAAYRRLLAQRPDIPAAHHNLGAALKGQGKSADAVAAFGRALRLEPNYPEAYSNLGDTLREMNQLEPALQALRTALKLEPRLQEAWSNLGIVYQNLRRYPEALEAYHRALALQPTCAETWSNMGNTLHQMNRQSEAIEAYQRALRIKPAYAQAWNNLGGTLRLAGRLDEAGDAYRRAIALRPAYPEALNNLGIVLRDMYQPVQAVEAFRRALSLRPEFADAWGNLAAGLMATGQISEAFDCFNRRLALDPDNATASRDRLYSLYFHPDFDTTAIFREARQWSDHFARPLAKEIPAHCNDPSPNRRLRIGYISPDFRRHCQALFMLPLLARHNHQEYEIFCYSSVSNPDPITARHQRYADVWRDIAVLEDQAVAESVLRDKIDILVDLTMQMGNSRLGVFARKPAPIQVSWLAYPGTTGLDAIDYRLSDPRLDPGGPEIRNPKSEIRINDPNSNDPSFRIGKSRGASGTASDRRESAVPLEHSNNRSLGFDSDFATKEPEYSESTIRLPDTFWCYHPRGLEDDENAVLPDPGPLPALTKGHLTFGCLNNFCKVTDSTLRLWSRVLAALPNAKLLMMAPAGPPRYRILSGLGITDPDRLQFVSFQVRRQYLETYCSIDLCLDTIPYNGHTTSLDAFWMGVPVVTRVGRTIVGRAGWSQLYNLDMTDLVAWSDEDFVKIALAWANDWDRLGRVRAELRGRMESSPLMDAQRFTRTMEAAYRWMWQTWCDSRS